MLGQQQIVIRIQHSVSPGHMGCNASATRELLEQSGFHASAGEFGRISSENLSKGAASHGQKQEIPETPLSKEYNLKHNRNPK